MNKNTACLRRLEGISFVTGGHQQVQTSKYFNSITSNQHPIPSITQLKECLKQCDKFYAEVMLNLSTSQSILPLVQVIINPAVNKKHQFVRYKASEMFHLLMP